MTALGDFAYLFDTEEEPDEEELRAALALMTPAERSQFYDQLEDVRPAPAPWEPLEHQVPPSLDEEWYGWLLLGGRGCVGPGTRIYLPETNEHRPISELAEAGRAVTVLSLGPTGPETAQTAGAPFVKGRAPLVEIETEDGRRVVVTARHRFLTPQGWKRASQVRVGQLLAGDAPVPPWAASASPSVWPEDGRRWMQTPEAEQAQGVSALAAPPPPTIVPPRPRPVPGWSYSLLPTRAAVLPGCSPAEPGIAVGGWSPSGYEGPAGRLPLVGVGGRQSAGTFLMPQRSRLGCFPLGTSRSLGRRPLPRVQPTKWLRILRIRPAGVGPYYDLTVPGNANYLAEGLWHHNSGKTAGVTHWLDEHAAGPPCLAGRTPHRMGIIAPTLGDASASIVHGDDGLIVINPTVVERAERGGTVVRWPNGAIAHLFGVNTRNDVDRLRSKGNRCADLREEIAAWRYLRDGMDQADLGLRKGLARWVGATTPRPRPTIRRLVADPTVRWVGATTADNPHLPAWKRAQLYERFGNTRVGLQELEGKILEDVAGALWTQELIEQYRVDPEEVPRIVKVRTYVDPSWGTTNDECGIVVCGLGANRHVYVAADLSKRTTPGEWAMLAALGRRPTDEELMATDEDGRLVAPEPREFLGRVSERVLAEKNFQGEQVRLAMRQASIDLHRRVLFGWVEASQGKRLRAEPVLQAYERGKVHHVGHLEGLEWQMSNWVPPEAKEVETDQGDPAEVQGETSDVIDPSKWSPDRLDALVFGVTDLILGRGSHRAKLEVADGRIPPSRPNLPAVGRIPRATRQGQFVERELGPRRPPR